MNNKQKLLGNGNIQTVGTVGDVTIINGISYLEVRTIFEDLFKLKVLNIEKIAKKVANENLEFFCENHLKPLMIKSENIINIETLKAPDFQYFVGNALKMSGLKGEKIELKTLATLIVERLKTKDDNIQSIIEQCMEIIPKISKKSIIFLAFIVFLKNIIFEEEKFENSLDKLVVYYRNGLEKLDEIPELIYSEKSYLETLNLMETSEFLITSEGDFESLFFNYLSEKYNSLFSNVTNEKIKELIDANPIFTTIEKFYGGNLEGTNLTILGKIIGYTFLKSRIQLDFSIDEIMEK